MTPIIAVFLVGCCCALPVSIKTPLGCFAVLATGACAFSTRPPLRRISQIPYNSSMALEAIGKDTSEDNPYPHLPAGHSRKIAWDAKLLLAAAEWNERTLPLEEEDSLLVKQSKLYLRNKALLDMVCFLDGVTATFGVCYYIFNRIGNSVYRVKSIQDGYV
jgi:hypothetical protein